MNSIGENDPQNVNIEQNEIEKMQKKEQKRKTIKIYPTFIFLVMLNLSLYFYCNYYSLNFSFFSISLYTFLYKYQFYRLITHHFMHYGICHLFIELLITFYLCKSLEKMIGTILSFIFILVNIISTSLLFVIFILIFKFIGYILNLNFNNDFLYECGMSSLLFSLFTYIIVYKANKQKIFKILNIIHVNVKSASFVVLFMLILFTPNKTFFGNISGMINAYIIKHLIGSKIYPKYEAIYDFEKYFKLNFYDSCYISVMEPNEEMKDYLINIFNNINFSSSQYNEKIICVQMNEIQNPNNNNLFES